MLYPEPATQLNVGVKVTFVADAAGEGVVVQLGGIANLYAVPDVIAVVFELFALDELAKTVDVVMLTKSRAVVDPAMPTE